MSGSPDPWGAVSGAPLQPTELAEDRLTVPEDQRYEPGAVLGSGGMGVVHRAFDVRLQRDVALKRMRAGRDDARFVREAELTARLQHPGIVPVYGAGRGPDGTPWYTMPVAAGSSLADALERRPLLADRLGLLRSIVAACRALAAAHAQGVLHRDVKPDNLVLGELGETWVVDWGLACELTDAEAREGDVVGSPGYMAPEQARGGPIDARADQYAMGVTLLELLAGRPPAPFVLPDPPPEAPPELVAVARKATAARPDARYADLRAMADDLEAWFEGRRVAAHEYGAFELLGRLVRAWRAPLAVAGVAAVFLLVGAVQASVRVAAQRDVAESWLGASLLAQARTAERDGHRADAELLAAEVLRRRDDPEARGVLLSFAGRRRPSRVGGWALPEPCATAALDTRDTRVACGGPGGTFSLALATGEVRRTAQPATLLGYERDGDRLVLVSDTDLWAWDGGVPTSLGRVPRLVRPEPGPGAGTVVFGGQGDDVVLDVASGGRTSVGRCPERGPHVAAHHPTGGSALVCRGLGLLLGDRVVSLSFDEPGALVFSGDGRWLAAAAADGRVALVDVDSAAVAHRIDAGPAAPTHIALDAAGTRLAVAGTGGGTTVWDTTSGLRIDEIPGESLALGFTREGHLRVVTERAVEDWEVRAGGRTPVLPSSSGVAGLSWAPDGERLAVAHGSGAVRLVDAVGGELLAEAPAVPGGVAKDVAFSPDGTRLATVSASDARVLRILEVPSLEEQRRVDGDKHRRVGWLGDDVLALPYATGARRVAPDGTLTPIASERPGVDLATDGHRAVLLWMDGTIRAPDGPVLATAPEARAVALAGGRTWWAGPDGVAEVGGPTFAAGDEVLDLAAAPNGRWLATAHLDGTARVWSDEGELLAVLRGHRAQVSVLAFSPDGRWLATGSWDGDVRQWSTDPLDLAPEELARTVVAAWGRTFADVISER
ncbi:MAG: protein kinase [Alphaproteobacteria bacterium]|nr:protein kinase [Alphaproteobacteria bacterium]